MCCKEKPLHSFVYKALISFSCGENLCGRRGRRRKEFFLLLASRVFPLLSEGYSSFVMVSFCLHLISDSTGETVQSLSRACLALFPSVSTIEHLHPLIHNETRMAKVLPMLEKERGIVVFSLANQPLAQHLQDFCAEHNLPCFSVLEGPLKAFAQFFGVSPSERSGAQHAMDDNYFRRIEALHFTIAHDDGNGLETLDKADVLLLGVSRTSKTPTCFQLANRGLRAANVPFVLGVPPPKEIALLACKHNRPAFFGLTCACDHLLALRRNRLLAIGGKDSDTYVDPERVHEEITAARQFFQSLGMVRMIDVTHRSIEETASSIARDLEKKHVGHHL